MSTAEIVAKLAAAGQKLEQAQAKAAAAAQDAAEARTLVAGALQGSTTGQLVGLIDQVRESLGQAASATGPARNGVQQTIAKVQALGN
jgi:hypothetical protein